MKIQISILAIFSMTYMVNANSPSDTINGFTWHYATNNSSATILSPKTKYFRQRPKAHGEVFIPQQLVGLPVQTIGHDALYFQDEITSLSIPEGIKVIERNAFDRCTNLVSISFPQSLRAIHRSAFAWCSKLESLILTNGIESIGISAFSLCENLREVKLPSSLTNIGEGAFSRCKNLAILQLPKSLPSINDATFYQCENLESIIIPSSVTNIGENAFAWCSKLNSVIFSNSTCNIGARSFKGCSSLSSINLPNMLSNIPYEAFEYCWALKSITIPDSVTNIALRAFIGCRLESVIIGSGVQKIEDVAFANNSKLRVVEFRGNAPQFGEDVFSGVMGPNASTNCVFRIHRGTTGWNIIEPSSTNESPRIQFDGCSFPVEYVDDVSDEE